MAKVKVTNPTARTKAVRVVGGLVTIKPGKSATIEDAPWDEAERAKYDAAGLEIEDVKPRATKATDEK